jgi:hypothetical protein
MTVEAQIVQVRPSLESTPYVIVTLRARNDEAREVRVRRYRILWRQGSFEATPHDFIIPSLGTREWSARVDYRCGDIKALLADMRGARVEVLDVSVR